MKHGKDRLCEDLKRQILTMELDPDQDLDEASVGQDYGLSRPPVREIRRRLEGEGYIEIRANRGARVIPMNHRHDGFIAAIANRDEDAVVDLVFEHWELSRHNMELFIAPDGMKAGALAEPITKTMETSF